MDVRAVRTRVFTEGEDIVPFITGIIPRIKNGSVIVVTSKIVALSEERTVVIKTPAEKKRLIRGESSWQASAFSKWWLTIRDGTVVVNAGVDDSNGNGKTILLPHDSFAAAARIRTALKKHYRVKDLGVLITDSRISPLRAGVTGVALGYAGFRGVRDYRGTNDIFGRVLKVTQTNVADCLASAAVLMMGEGGEQCPLGIIENAPVVFAERVSKGELTIPMKDDVYKGLFRS